VNHLEHTRRERGISYRQFAEEIGADGYSEDANGAVKLVDQLLA